MLPYLSKDALVSARGAVLSAVWHFLSPVFPVSPTGARWAEAGTMRKGAAAFPGDGKAGQNSLGAVARSLALENLDKTPRGRWRVPWRRKTWTKLPEGAGPVPC